MNAYRSFRDQTLHYFTRPHEGVPEGAVASPADWRGPELKERPQDWLVELTPEDRKEIIAAVETIRASGTSMEKVRRETFLLPTLAPKIADWRRRLSEGLGLVAVRGMPVEELGEERASIAFWGLGHHLGVPGAQNPANELLGHVKDYGEEADKPHIRRYRTAGHIAFHCDAADVVGLLCLQPAKAGGQSRIASSVAIFNEIAKRRPDLIRHLFEPVKLDRRGEHRPGEPGYVELPICAYGEGRLRTFYHSDYMHSVTRLKEAGPHTENEAEILALYDELAGSRDFYLDMWLEKGDMQFISNHTVVHSRTEYEDDPAHPRHLLRLWLSLES